MNAARTLKNPLPNKHCKNCGGVFSPYRKKQEYCTTRCRSLFYWKTHEVVKIDGVPQVVELSSDVTASALTGNDNTQTPSANTESK